MSRIFFAVLIIVFSQFAPFVTKVQALGESTPCLSPDFQITYQNPDNGSSNQDTYFYENSGDLHFRFKLNLQSTHTALVTHQVRLHLPGGWVGLGDKNTSPATIRSDSTEFDLIVPQDWTVQTGVDDHEGSLQFTDDKGDWQGLCSAIKYKVGTGKSACIIGALPAEIPPDYTFDEIRFLGHANTNYVLKDLLFFNTGGNSLVGNLNTRTDNYGNGKFSNIKVQTKQNGDTLGLSVEYPNIAYSFYFSCHAPDIKIKFGANPTPVPTGPIIPITTPGPMATPCSDFKSGACSYGGGQPVDDCTKDRNNPGVATAIGCIHTNPTELVKDFMKFGVGIGGGLAFLMMLLGAFQMLTSSGNPETLNAGKERLTSAVIGLLFIIFAVLLLKIIGVDILGLGAQFGY